LRVRNQFPALHIKAPYFREWIADELGDDCEDGAGVDGETFSIEGGVAHAVGVEVAAIRIACPCSK